MENTEGGYPSYRWVILLSYMFLALMTQFLWINFATITTIIEEEYKVSELAVGWLAMIFPLLYIPISLPSGAIIDSKGYKVGVGIGAIFTGVFSIIRFLGKSYLYLFVGQLGIALGQPFVLNGVSKMASNWFPEEEREIATGLGTMAIFIGVLIGFVAPPILVEMFGVIDMLKIVSALAILSMLLFWVLTKERPRNLSVAETEKLTISVNDFLKLIKIRDFLILCFLIFIGMGAFNGISTWIEVIMAEHGIGRGDTSLIGGLIIIGGIIGAVIIPALSTKFGTRKFFAIIAVLGAMPSFLAFASISDLTILFIPGFWLGFIMMPALPILLDWSAEISGRSLAGTSASILMLFSQIGGFIIPLLMEIVKIGTGTFFWSLLILVVLYIAILPFLAITKDVKH